MQEKAIGLGGTEFTLSSGSPFKFEGVHSGRELSGIDLNIIAYSEVEAHQVEELLKKDTVEVEDPFTDRKYEAILTRKSSSYQEGRREEWYHLEVRELDEAPLFTQLEIEGHSFNVLRNTESLYRDEIGIHVLLRLSPEEFLTFHTLRELDSIKIRRLGIDESPIARRFGGAPYWSSHEEESQKYYKQIVRFFAIDDLPKKPGISLQRDQMAQSRMILALSARYEALVKMLVEKGQIGRESGESLMSDEWRSLIEYERRVILRSKLTEIDDAEVELD